MKWAMKQLRIINDESRNSSLTCNSRGYLVIRNCVQYRSLIRACMKVGESAHQVRNFGDWVLGLENTHSSVIKLDTLNTMPKIPYPKGNSANTRRKRKAIFRGAPNAIV